MEQQLKRGVLNACVLALLARGDSYGYRIIRELPECLGVGEPTLYPILRRLLAAELVEDYNVEHNGRLRKFYRITARGRSKIEEFKDDWRELITAYDFICGETEGKKDD